MWSLLYKANQKDEMESLRKSGSDEEYERESLLYTAIHSALTSTAATKLDSVNSQNDSDDTDNKRRKQRR